ncbi:MAG: hypothetical protein MJ236_00845 [Clostridia bacterium]|nr:hypothetical protein [Clostridia bacterium]
MPDTNKVILGDEVLIDLTSDTVSADNMLQGTTAHDASGRSITGAVVVAPIDDEISFESENPVQNKVIALALDGKDAKPTELTKAEYDALPEDKKKQGEYFITDWKPETGGGSLDTLSDVNIENPQNKQALVYKDGEWVNEEVQGGGGNEWSGTRAEYEAIKSTLADGTIVYITDDYDSSICQTVADCVSNTNPNNVAGANAVKELNGSLKQIKFFDFTGTTSSNGTLSTGKSLDNILPICAYDLTTENRSYEIYRNSSNVFSVIVRTVPNQSAVASTSISARLVYVDK